MSYWLDVNTTNHLSDVSTTRQSIQSNTRKVDLSYSELRIFFYSKSHVFFLKSSLDAIFPSYKLSFFPLVS